MTTFTVGVDPGISGAIALLEDGHLVDVYDMPVVAGHVSAHGVNNLESWDTMRATVVIEDVHAMPKQGVTSSFNFGRSKGVIEGVFAACCLPIVYVTPTKWKRALGLTSDKETSRRRAIEQWPDKAHLFTRKKDDGRAEAALIAWWYITKGNGRGDAS